jgi:cytochrome c peroxidase
VRANKTPSLRNVAHHAPYMHAGQFATLTIEDAVSKIIIQGDRYPAHLAQRVGR